MTPPSHVEEPTVAPMDIAGEEIKPNLGIGRMLAYSLANLGYGAFYTLNNAVLPLFLQAFTKNAIIIGLASNSHSFEGAIIQPIIGSASDRMRSKWGRRRPFMMVFVPLSTLFLLLTPLASHLPTVGRLVAMVTCIFLFTVTFNITQDPYNALMPDITPDRQRGRMTGISMFVNLLGQMVLVLLPGKLTLPLLGPTVITLETKFGIAAGLMLVTTFLTCFLVHEPQLRSEPGYASSHLQVLKLALQGLRTLRQARKGLLTIFLSGVGIGAVFPFLTLFVKTITHCTDNQAQMMFLVLVVSTAVFVLPFGWLVDRLGAKSVLLIALTLIALAAVNGLWVTTLAQIRIVLALAGIGSAAQFAAAYPLLTELVPAEEIGFYTGLRTTAESIAAPVTAIVTGTLVNIGGYRSIFAVCAICLVAAIITLRFVDMEAIPSEITTRRNLLKGTDTAFHPVTPGSEA